MGREATVPFTPLPLQFAGFRAARRWVMLSTQRDAGTFRCVGFLVRRSDQEVEETAHNVIRTSATTVSSEINLNGWRKGEPTIPGLYELTRNFLIK